LNVYVIIGYVSDEYATVNPIHCTNWTLLSVNQLVFEPVVDLDASLKPIPMLANNWVQDGKNWIFNLRSGIQFHNGYELTAYDVVRSYQTLMQAGEENPYYERLQVIENMDASPTDIYGLTVTAKNTSLMTLYAMVFPVIQYDTLYDDLPRGTGPYWYIQADPEGSVRLEANPLWWKQQPEIRSILLKRYYNVGDAIEAIRTHEIDMLSTKSTKASLSRKLAGLTSIDYPTLTYEMLVPNLSDGSLTSDASVRQAIMYAIDRSVIASNGYLDMAVQCEVPVPPSSWLYESQSAIYYYSPERALQLMHNLGWYDLTGDGTLNKHVGVMVQEPTLSIITYNESSNSIRENAANLIADYLRTVGFNVTVTIYSKERTRQLVKDGEFDLALVGVNLSEVPYLSSLLGSRGSLNLNHYSSDDMDQLLERVYSASDETLMRKIYSDIQMTVVNRLPILGLLFRTGTVLSSRSVGGMSGVRVYDTFNGFEFLKKVN
jgi:peptide/nickel transport system substrate-binding protein